MKIKSFSFKNNSQNWQIKEVSFDNLNLLVGGSGVGKTSILKALHLICNVAQGNFTIVDNVEWTINFSHLGKNYRWDLKTSSIEATFSLEPKQSEISDEKLSRFEDDLEIEILHRTSESSKLDDEKLHKLKRTESAIPLLAEEASIEPIADAFKRIIFTEMLQNIGISIQGDSFNHRLLKPSPDNADYYHDCLRVFKEEFVDMPTVLTGYFLQVNFPTVFDEIKAAYADIFSNVKDVRVSTSKESNDRYSLFFEIEEYGLEDKWIPQHRISSGMYLTLAYLIEISSVPEDSVFIVDEFENSLGINCMPQLTDIILDKSPKLQFILTSHHPYIINNIPWKTWQLVSRTNGTIKTRKAIDIPQLDTASRLDKFTQLLNLLEYEDAVS